MSTKRTGTANIDFTELSAHELIHALTHSLQCAEVLVETGMDMDLDNLDPFMAKMYLAALLRLIQNSRKISSEIFTYDNIVH
jgi:hypothetical protein